MKEVFMNILASQVEALCEEKDDLAMLANVAAAINMNYEQINWAGFYLYKNDELVLGPFQGKVACTHIPMGKGVCGTSASNKKTIIVEDVHKFEGHIACDSASNSEIVVPIIYENTLIGVIDIDSFIFNRFNNEDKEILEEVAKVLANRLKKMTISHL
ncbi:MAG: GAF domain-containing protein [Firmicutes bacterium]|nr:GAF domain-containing protein [Erysipelotrichaceae bacterium]MDD6525135.1 GAF domain-containing protein [Bacillota bacterium]MDD7228301.1 GAF domain-containing protein [Bacillota bacterium]